MEEIEILDLLVPVFLDGLTPKCVDKLAEGLKNAKLITETDAKLVTSVNKKDLQKKIHLLFKAIKFKNSVGWRFGFTTLVLSICKSEKKDFKREEVANITEKVFDPDYSNLFWVLKNWNLLNERRFETPLKNSATYFLNKKELSSGKLLFYVCNYVATSEPDSKMVADFIETMTAALSPISSDDGTDSMISVQSSLRLEDIEAPASHYRAVEGKLGPLLTMLSDVMDDGEIRAMAGHLFDTKHISKNQSKKFKTPKEGQLPASLSPRTTAGLMNKLFESLRQNAKQNWEQDFLSALKKLERPTLYLVVSRCWVLKEHSFNFLCHNWEFLKHDKVELVAKCSKQCFQSLQLSENENPLVQVLRSSEKVDVESLEKFVLDLQSGVGPHSTETLEFVEHYKEEATNFPSRTIQQDATPSYSGNSMQRYTDPEDSNGSVQHMEPGSFEFNSGEYSLLDIPKKESGRTSLRSSNNFPQLPEKEENILVRSCSSDEESNSFTSDADSNSSLFADVEAIEDKLNCLISMLANVLTNGQVKVIARELTARHHLSRTQYKNHFRKVKNADNISNTVRQLVECLKRNAQINWKKDFMTAIKILDNPQLGYVLDRWLFSHKNTGILKRLFDSYLKIEQNKAAIIEMATDVSIISPSSQKEMKRSKWFLLLLTSVLSSGENYLLQFEKNIDKILEIDPQIRMECEPSQGYDQTTPPPSVERMDFTTSPIAPDTEQTNTSTDEEFEILKDDESSYKTENDVPYERAVPTICPGVLYSNQPLPGFDDDSVHRAPSSHNEHASNLGSWQQGDQASKLDKPKAIVQEKLAHDAMLEVKMDDLRKVKSELEQKLNVNLKSIKEKEEKRNKLMKRENMLTEKLKISTMDQTKEMFAGNLRIVETDLQRINADLLELQERSREVANDASRIKNEIAQLEKERQPQNKLSQLQEKAVQLKKKLEEKLRHFKEKQELLIKLKNKHDASEMEMMSISEVMETYDSDDDKSGMEKVVGDLSETVETTSNEMKKINSELVEIKDHIEEIHKILESVKADMTAEKTKQSEGSTMMTRAKKRELDEIENQKAKNLKMNSGGVNDVNGNVVHKQSQEDLDLKRKKENSESSFAQKVISGFKNSLGLNEQEPKKVDLSKFTPTDPESQTMSDFERKPSEGKFILEFQVLLNNVPKLIEGDVLVMFDVMKEFMYPLTFCPIQKVYTFQMEVEKNPNIFYYKYYIYNSKGEVIWEYIPGRYYGDRTIFNRKLDLSREMIRRGHVIVFDLIQIQHVTRFEYEEALKKNFDRFLPSFDQIRLNEENTNLPINFFIRIFSDWIHACDQGMLIQGVGEYYTRNISTIKDKDFSLRKFVHEMCVKLTADCCVESRCKRVFGMFVLLCLMENRSIYYDNKQAKSNIVRCLSIHDLSKDDQLLLKQHLCNFIRSWSFKLKSLLELFNKAMPKLNTIPEVLLVIPIYETIFEIHSELNVHIERFPAYKFDQLHKYRTIEDQKIVLTMQPHVSSLHSTFPTLQKYYEQMLSLESTKVILAESGASNLLSEEGIAKKMLFMWSQLSNYSPSEKVTEEIFVVLTSHFGGNLKQLTTQLSQYEGEQLNIKLNEIHKHFKTFEKILHLVVRYCKNTNVIHNGYVSITFDLIDQLIKSGQSIINYFQEDDECFKKNISAINSSLLDTLSKLFEEQFAMTILASDIDFWNMLLREWSDDEFNTKWMNRCRDLIKKNIVDSYKYKLSDLLEFFAEELEGLKPHSKISDWFSEVVLDMVEKEPETTGWGNRIKESILRTPKMKKVCKAIFKKQWNHVEEQHRDYKSCIIELIESWKPVVTILKLLSSIIKKESDELHHVIANIKHNLIDIGETVKDGTIIVRHFQQIFPNKKIFLATLNAMVGTSVDRPEHDNLEMLIDIRKKELDYFYQLKLGIQQFTSIDDILEKCGFATNKVQFQTNVKDLKFTDIVTCSFEANAPIEVKSVNISTQQQHLLINFENSKAVHSDIIKLIVEEIIQSLPEDLKEQEIVLDLYAIMEEVWMPTLQHVCKIVAAISDGTISFHDLNRYFGKLVGNVSATLKAELGVLLKLRNSFTNEEPTEFEGTRLWQLEECLQMFNSYKAAKIIKRLQTKFDLSGSFALLSVPLEMHKEGNKLTLNSITKKLVETSKTLEVISPQRRTEMETFLNNDKLLLWLKDNIKSVNEVKVMNDLAMISAGENSKDVDIVSCFSSAVMGFAPLIFDMPKTSGFKEVVTACEAVWKNIQQKPKILEEWVATGKKLDWLKGVKELYGSVEKSSLSRAQKINIRGVYQIGSKKVAIPTVENSMKLTLNNQAEEDKGDKKGLKEMYLSDLRDLQSRLMLIAGEAEKGKQDVDVFITMLSSVENLAKAYVKLKTSGCLLFQNWSATVICSESRSGEHLTLSVYFDSESPPITSRENALEEVIQLTKVLNEAYDKWKTYLNTKRTSHYFLNHFNIHQLTYLCKQLAKCNEYDDLPDQVYVLLSSVRNKLDFDEIVEVLDEVTRITDNNDDVVMEVGESSGMSMVERKRKVVRQLISQDVEERIAKAAVQKQSARNLDIDECFMMSLELEYDAEIVELERQFNQEAGFVANGRDINAMQDIVNDRFRLSLREIVEKIQSGSSEGSFASKISTISERYLNDTAVTSLADSVSLEHLGRFLEMISENAQPSHVVERDWPEQFVPGKPNLVLCSETDMWRTILSIYCHSPENELPSTKEVLICTEHTSSEEVELLLRRAMCADENKNVFCIGCADQLKFNVAQDTEKIFQQISQSTQKNSEFRLIIATTSTQHYTTCCFGEFQVDKSFTKTEEEIKRYLAKHLSAKNVKESAAIVDPGRSVVRVISSEAAGMGKSLYISRCRENLEKLSEDKFTWNSSVVRFLEKSIDADAVMDSLLHGREDVLNSEPHFIQLDITPSVQSGVFSFLFNLIFLGSVQNSRGVVWKREPQHFYAIEYTLPQTKVSVSFLGLLNLLPQMSCLSPLQILQLLQDKSPIPLNTILMDNAMLKSNAYQRPFQYLLRYASGQDLDLFTYTPQPRVNALECLQTLLKYCSVKDPSWAELSHFTKFLNIQLSDCEKSVFCDRTITGDDSGLNGFKQFVVRFMIRMSQDFSTPSIAEGFQVKQDGHNNLSELYQLRRSWEGDIHPYLFFNNDRVSMSFFHFNINRNGSLCHPKTKQVIEQNIMSKHLVLGLHTQLVNLDQDFDRLLRSGKIETLCEIFGVKPAFDPDPTYELITDNVLKMLAIHMRFRCGIPVIVMGETGCGKTRMIEFMCRLKAGGKKDVRNMVIVKVHGGITVAVIQQKVREAIDLAKNNLQKGNVETILFLDEANTTEAIYAIKEVVCDGSVNGVEFKEVGLRIVAACNPYRKHSDEVIKTMENSGLGFNVKAEDTKDKFGNIPMRHLVYRVIAFPPSMLPLVWDFGQLSNEAEGIYIQQMVLKLHNEINSSENLPNLDPNMAEVISKALVASQHYMRSRRDLSSFVSLRDVERTIQSYKWFYQHLEYLNAMIDEAKRMQRRRQHRNVEVDHAYRALILSLGMCYHATLEERKAYREVVTLAISNEALRLNEDDFLQEVIACQIVFIEAVELEKNIARNEALRENVFMIVLCAEMRIPLFLVGKPGSSKSLAKTVATDAMRGPTSNCDLFKRLKQIQVLSFQCSPVTDAVGIETVFSQCAQLQKNQDLNKYVAVVVLDEIGLAEDSPKMPLKVLHPLLEAGSTQSSNVETEAHHKVGFVGISNWSLDPAKMNRGIFVTRGKPSDEDLLKTAKGIFESNENTIKLVEGLIESVTNAYLEIYNNQEKEFFGLRDYYALLKMMFSLVIEKEDIDTYRDIGTLVLRNFSGHTNTDTLAVFKDHLANNFPFTYEINTSVIDLIKQNLDLKYESRFLLLLTNQYAAISLLNKVMSNDNYVVIFGSSFPRDKDYTEICRNINRIKICMESGTPIVLLNLQDLYESLYDALNQHYVTFAGQRYVDLGLGGHRVKCRIAENFRLIVIEEKDVVYKEFPIPLINRLEKHILEMNSVLSRDQETLFYQLKEWVNNFAQIKTEIATKKFEVEDTFAGYQDDTTASAVLKCDGRCAENEIENEAKLVLLQSASYDGVCRLSKSRLKKGVEHFRDIYFNSQHHDNLVNLLRHEINKEARECDYLSVFEITSFSHILTDQDRITLEELLELPQDQVMLVNLQQFQTEQEYSGRLDEFFQFSVFNNNREHSDSATYVLLIQCTNAQENSNLISCAKYSALEKIKSIKQEVGELSTKVVVCFLFTLERHSETNKKRKPFTSFHNQSCTSVFVDELQSSKNNIGLVSALMDRTISDVIDEGLQMFLGDEQQLNLGALIRQCTPEAVAKLTNKTKILSRNRVKILIDACFHVDKIANSFFITLIRRILLLLKEREKDLQENWVVTEACSPQSLQEGGTFTNTLWLKLRKVTAVVLAKIISVADVDNNLDIVVNPESSNHILELWLTILDSVHYCKISWVANFYGIQFNVENKINFSNKFPFSRMIFDILSRQWSLTGDGETEKFYRRMEQAKIHEFLKKSISHNAKEMVKFFVHDLVHLFYKSQSDDNNHEMEFQAVQDSLLTFFYVKRKGNRESKNPLIELFVLFKSVDNELKQFSEIVASCSDILVHRGDWVDQQELSTEFILPASAFSNLVSYIREQASGIDKVGTCQQWKARMMKTRQVSDKIVASGNLSDEVRTSWKHLVFVNLFIDQLIPTSNVNAQKYLSTLASLARRLWKGASTTPNMSGDRFVKIITNTLQGCTKDILLKILCNWEDVKCKSCKADKINTPVMLPCRHLICQKCIPVNEERRCPICGVAIPNDLKLEPVELNKENGKEYEHFKNSCTSFFLEYLSTFCFPLENDFETVPLDENVFKILESLVICDKKTKVISPLQSNFDENPTARSYILNLLLRCNPAMVQIQLNHHFQSMGDVLQDKSILMGVYTQCIQDKLHNELKLGWNSVQFSANADFSLQLFEECQKLCKNTRGFTQVQHLDMCAKLQFVARECLKCMKILAENKTKNFEDYQNMEILINRVCMFCKTRKHLIYQQYLIKCLCRRFGVGELDFFLNIENYKKCIVPENLLPPEDADDSNLYRQSDLFILCGDIYSRAKSLFLGIACEEDIPGILNELINLIQQSNDSLTQIALALSAWCAHGNVTNELKAEGKNVISQRLQLNQPGKINQQLCDEIARGDLNVLRPVNATPNLHYKVVELISMVGISFHGKAGLVSLFSEIIADPSQLPNLFLPTMPQSNYFDVKDVLKLEISHSTSPKAYMCPNNHVYFIGECTNPVQAGICPECKCKIGGQRYGLLHDGNRVSDLTEASQAGYLLGDPTATTISPERNLTKLSVCVIRICLHACLLLNARQNKNIHRVMKFEGDQAEVIQFMLGHLVNDLTKLGTFLGKSFDDTLILVHQILHRIRKSQANPAENQMSLTSMKNRMAWEELFQRNYLSLVFKDAERITQEGQQALIKAGKLAEAPLQRMVFELNEDIPVKDGIVGWDHPNLWKYKLHIDMQHLRQKLEAVDAKAGGEGSILKPLLEVENLNLVQYIEDIAYVQSTLINRYTQKIDMADSDRITLQDFLLEDENVLQDKLFVYITIWNQIRDELVKADRYNTDRDFLKEEMNLNSPISMCLPNNRGRGCCGLVFLEYLIGIQNDLLANCRDKMLPKPRFDVYDVANIGKANLVCIEEELDLMPIVLANSQYEATAGNNATTGISYNIGLLEKKVVEKFILRKAIIDIKSIPRIQYPQDMGLNNEWETVKDGQIPLPQRMCVLIDEKAKQGRTADICEAVRTLTLVIQFLAKLGGEDSQGICDYAERDIMLPTEETNNVFIPKSAQIRHCLSLYERLSWHRALRLFGNRQNPFENILADTDDINDEELEAELVQKLSEMNIQRLQFELNALLMLGPEASPDWSLSDVLVAYLEKKYDSDELDHSWCEKIPRQVLFKHAVHVFRLSIQVQLFQIPDV